MIDETLNKKSADDTGETKPEVSAKELVSENKELFEELLGKEDYVLQLDSHHRFVKGWDSKCIRMIKQLEKKVRQYSIFPI